MDFCAAIFRGLSTFNVCKLFLMRKISVISLSRGILSVGNLIDTVNREDGGPLLVSLAQLIFDHDERSPESNGEEGDSLKIHAMYMSRNAVCRLFNQESTNLRGESPLVVHVEGKTLKFNNLIIFRSKETIFYKTLYCQQIT